MIYSRHLLLLAFFFSCFNSIAQVQSSVKLQDLLENVEALKGRKEYLQSPYVTAGDRVYMVGHQDGTFPDLGWHVEGEMGGIWNHPVKLMDGFTIAIDADGEKFCLDEAESFINFPFANKHIFKPSEELEIERFQFVPEGKQGLVVELTMKNRSQNPLNLSLEFVGHTDLRPVWLGEKAGMVDHADTAYFDAENRMWTAKDKGNDWYAIFGSDRGGTPSSEASAICNYDPQGKGTTGGLHMELDISPGEEEIVTFFIAGSYTSLEDAQATFEELRENPSELLQQKMAHYETIAGMSKITIPDKELQQAFEWVKYNTEWLVRDVPEIGRGLGAGMPDYPWWFGVDNEYTLQGAIATGRKELTYETIDLIHRLSEKENGNGRIIHEVSTNGVVFNPGNINETPQFASLIWHVYQWTGEREFLEKYYPTVQKGLVWLMEENDEDGNLFPDGYGMMEIHGLESEMIDVATYTQAAFADAAQMALVLGDDGQAKEYQQTADKLRKKINEEFWVEEFNSYADFIGTAKEARELIKAAIVRADTLDKPWAVEELQALQKKIADYPEDRKQGFVVFHNWVVNTPMEMGIADHDKAIRALDKGSRFVNPFGVFVTGIDRDESAEMEDGAFAGSKVFSYTGAVMTLPTGVQAIAENNYGRPDLALDYLKRMTRSFGFALPGSIYEVSPDYGMMAQAWNLYSYAVPLVTQFFGIRPDAGNKSITISPQMPTDWDEAKIEKVMVGDNEIEMTYKKENGEVILEVNQMLSDWTLNVEFPKGTYSKWEIEGEGHSRTSTATTEGFSTTGQKINVRLKP